MSKSVLVIDDEKSLTDFMQKFLAKLDYQMLTASNGEEALSVLEKEAPELVLLDMKMPGIDGLEVLRIIRKEYPGTKVIVTTSFDEEYKKAVEELGVEGFFAKPISLFELLDRLEELIKK